MKTMRYHVIAIAFFLINQSSFAQKDHWTKLYNGKDLTGWNTYLAPEGGIGSKDSSGKLNDDPKHVFSIVKEGSENIIRVSGEQWGAISTVDEFQNYHLQLLFRWGTMTWGQKKGKKMDSGLLYHSVGPNGVDAKAWMRSQEFQIEEGNCGDYWGVAGGIEDIPVVKKSDSEYVYNPKGTKYTFSEKSPVGRHCIKNPDAEKPSGEWNLLDLYCHGDTSVHMVNGKVVMVLYHSGQSDNGRVTPLTKGKLQLQSEGAELFYKEIKIQPVNKIPEEYYK